MGFIRIERILICALIRCKQRALYFVKIWCMICGMSNYHLTVKMISRTAGQNAVKSAAYRHGQNFTCESVGKTFYYGKKKDVEHCEMSVPDDSPEWAKDLTEMDAHEASSKLWNAVEVIEKRKDAQVSREVEFSLPHELTKEQRLELARAFIQETFTSKGMIADWCVHNHFDEKDGIEKPHVHVMLTTRRLKEISRDQNLFVHKDICFGEKERSWNDKKFIQEIRQNWELCANKHLERAGLDVRLDHRSYEAQGIELDPQPKLGRGLEEMESRGYTVDRLAALERVKARNKLLIKKDPSIVLDTITRQQSVFTRREIARVLNRYIDDPQEFQWFLAQVEASSQLVRLHDQGVEKLTTKDMINLELSLLKRAEEMKGTEKAVVSPALQLAAVQETNERMGVDHRRLSVDQVGAIHHMTDAGQLKVVVGYAGAGKSTCLVTAKEIWEQAGYRVVGAAPTGKAADNLEGSGIASKTLHKWQYEWSRGREQLGEKDVFVVDEAGMVDSRRLEAVLRYAQKQGFKVVLMGDPEQLSPIEAGCGLRTVMGKAGFVEINTIQRQQEVWQREATRCLATRQTEAALRTYDDHGHVHLVHNAKDKLLEDYAVQMQTRLREEPLDCVILAYTNQDVKDLNQQARTIARRSGRLQGPDHLLTVTRYRNDDSLDLNDSAEPSLIKVIKEEKPFAVGDQIVFLRNDYGIGVKNGQFGVIQKIDEGFLQIETDRLKVVTFDLSLYRSFDHGYATTLHKSQASTVDKTFLYAGYGMDRHLTYVGLSRHRHEAHLYADLKTFEDSEKLYARLSRDNPKENALDYVLYPSQDPSPVIRDQGAALDPSLKILREDQHPWIENKEVGNGHERQASRMDRLFSVDQELAPVESHQRFSLDDKTLPSPALDDTLRFTQERDKRIVDYLKQEVRLEKHDWLEEASIAFIFKDIDKDPSQSLKRWQTVTNDYSFNPATAVSRDRPSLGVQKDTSLAAMERSPGENLYDRVQHEQYESIRTYLQEEVRLEKHDWLKEEHLPLFLKDMEQDPLKALKKWQDVTNDRSFKPLTREQAKEQAVQAQQLLKQVESSLSPEAFKKMVHGLPVHTHDVILKCQSVLHHHQEAKREADVVRFISLSRQYRESGYTNAYEKDPVRTALKEIAVSYEKDATFLRKLETFDDKTLRKTALELFKQETMEQSLHKERGRSRSIGLSL